MEKIIHLIPGVKILRKYLIATEKHSTPRFILELTSVCFFLKVIFIIFFGIVFTSLGINTEVDGSFEEEMVRMGILITLPLTIVFAAFETLIGQWLVIHITSKFTKRIFYQIFFSAVVFSLLHIEPMLVAAVFPIGIVLAWTFILYRRKSRWSAFWVTTAIHTLHNLVVFGLVWWSLKG